MNRYADIPILKTQNGPRYYATVKYPEVPLSEQDIYVITNQGDRLDLLASQYYGDPTLYWVISIANDNLTQGTITIPEGSQIRIPQDVNLVLNEYRTLNQL
jgi:hypothetical protein